MTMTNFSKILAIAIIFLSRTAWCEGAEPVLARRYEANKSSRGLRALDTRALDGSSLIKSWLGIRQLQCPYTNEFQCANNPGYCCHSGQGCCLPSDGGGCCDDGYGCCPSSSSAGCCPTGQNCCKGSDYCVEQGGVCCGTSGTCPSGWACCTDGTCYPLGGECCTTSFYCDPGTSCVLVDGVQKCAVTGSNVPTPTTQSQAPTTPAPTTPAPTAPAPTTTPSIIFTYYYYTITWSYIYYFYTWTIVAEAATTDLTSETTTLYTTLSVYESNSAAASSAFTSLSHQISLPTPAQLTNPVPVGTSPSVSSKTAAGGHSSTSVGVGGGGGGGGGGTSSTQKTSSTQTQTTPATATASSSSGLTSTSSSAGVSVRGFAWLASSWMRCAFVGVMLVGPGVLMIAL